jgi:prepilin-type N-terminal cleavage/methylation domain-containing protein
MSRKQKQAFTLVELLVVIAIIGLLVGLLLPAVQSAREASRRMSCSNNFRQIGLALHNYESANRSLPSAYYLGDWPNEYQPMAVGLLPFLDHNALYEHYDSRVSPLIEPGTASMTNVEVISTPLNVFVCPSAPGNSRDRIYEGSMSSNQMTDMLDRLVHPPVDPETKFRWLAAPSDFIVCSGVQGKFLTEAFKININDFSQFAGALQPSINKSRVPNRLSNVTDGLSQTMFMGERTGGKDYYVGHKTIRVAAELQGINGGGWGDVFNGRHWLGGSMRNAYYPATQGECPINCNNFRESNFHSFHRGGCHFLFGDNAVQFVSKSISPYVLASQITSSNGETFARQ